MLELTTQEEFLFEYTTPLPRYCSQHETLVRHPYKTTAGNARSGKSAPSGIRDLFTQNQIQPPPSSQWQNEIGPLFPRYLFIRLDLDKDNISPIPSTRGVSKLVSFSGQPATVPDPFIDTLLQLETPDTELLYFKATLFKAGTTVTIVDGPLEGMEAIFKAPDGEHRSIILLDILGKTQQLRIDRNHLAPSKYG